MERIGFVYVLHFDAPLAHSQHYVGCTSDLRGRLVTHAQGRGARIVAAALDVGIGFTLGAVGTTNIRCMRRLERQAKDWHGAQEFCERCRGDLARAIPGTRPYSLDNIEWPMKSAELALSEPWGVRREVRFTTPEEPASLAQEIRELMQPDKDALGFIPVGGQEGLTLSAARGRIVIARAGQELIGYCAFTESAAVVRIHQCCTKDKFRGCGVGRAMVDLVAGSRPAKAVQAKVRDDLPANEFWQAIGFKENGFETHETSGQRLNIYRRAAITGEVEV